MRTELAIFMQKLTVIGLSFCTNKTRAITFVKPHLLPDGNKLLRFFACVLLLGVTSLMHLSPTHATAPDILESPNQIDSVITQLQLNCSITDCISIDQPTHLGYKMFNETNFFKIIDGFGRTRKFYVHIPGVYDTVDGIKQKIPLIFAFHGGGQEQEAMIKGKWGDYFDQNIAFVIPYGEPDPCNYDPENTHWMQPGFSDDNSTPTDKDCDPATQVVDSFGDTMAFWNASIQGTFIDVLFVEQLRAMILSRFPKLNGNKVYATGFSSGGGMTLSFLCYRSNLFRAFSVVAKMLAGDSAQGDYNWDGVDQTDANSLVATCGKPQWDADHAMGLATPRLWGYGVVSKLPTKSPFIFKDIYIRVTKPVALFAGDQDRGPIKIAAGSRPSSFGIQSAAERMQDINDTGEFIKSRNNLNGIFFIVNPFLDAVADDATTQRRTFVTASNSAEPYSVFRRFLVQGIANHPATHATPDAQECPPLNWSFGDSFSTCDYDYTDQTKIFFEEHADLNLNPLGGSRPDLMGITGLRPLFLHHRIEFRR